MTAPTASDPSGERDADDARRRGVAAFRRRQFGDAIAHFEAWAALQPQDAVALRSLARAQVLAGLVAAARRQAERAVAMEPSAPRGHLLLASIAAREGDGRLRIAALRAAVALLPGAVALRLTLAGLMGRRLQHGEALAVARDAMALAPHDPSVLMAVARCHLALKEPIEAGAVLDRVAAAGPHAADLDRLRGEIASRAAPVDSPAAAAGPPPSTPAAGDGAAASATARGEILPIPARAARRPFARLAERPGTDDIEARITASALWAIERRRRRFGIADHLLILRALILRDIRIRHRGNHFGVLTELARPSIVVVVHYWLFLILKKAMPAEIPIEIFVLAGFSTWFAFNGALIGAETGGKWSGGATLLPGITDLHMRVAKAAWALMLNLAFCLLAVLPLNLFGSDLPLPAVPLTCLVFGMASGMGFGLGLMLERLQGALPFAKTFEKIVFWALFVTAGLYFSLSLTPPPVAGWFWYNPLLHLLEYERHAFDPGYPVALVDLRYPAVVTAVVLALGIVIHKGVPCADPD